MRQRTLHTVTALVHTYSTRPAPWNKPPRHFVPPLRRGELATYRCGAKFPSTEGCRRSRRGGLLVTRECVARARCALCVSLHRNKKTPVGRFFISGADNRAPALGNKLPNFVLFATARSPLVGSRLRVACLDYSYANLRFESGPDRGYKNTGGNAGIFITGADNRAPALGNKLPNFVLFATAHSPLVSSRLRVACLDYSYANLRFESGPDRGYKNTGGNAGIFITGADNRIRTGDTWYHKPVL